MNEDELFATMQDALDKLKESVDGLRGFYSESKSDEAILTNIVKLCEMYTYEEHSRQCMEECGEVIQAINKFWRAFPNFNESELSDVNSDSLKSPEYRDLVEELGDLLLTICELIYHLDCSEDIVNVFRYKSIRQLDRLQDDRKDDIK